VKVMQQRLLTVMLTAGCVFAAGVTGAAGTPPAGAQDVPAARTLSQAIALKRATRANRPIRFAPGVQSYFVVADGNPRVTPATLRRAGLRGLMGSISRVYEDGNNRQVLDDQPLQPGIIYAARFDRATTIDFRTVTVLQADEKTRLRSDAPAAVRGTPLTRAATPDDGTRVVLLYDDTYRTKRYKCWSDGKSGAWDGITDGVTGADDVKNAGVVRRGKTLYVRDEAGTTGQERVTVLAPAEPGQARAAVSWATRYDTQRGAFAIDIPADAPVGDYQVQIGATRANYVTAYIVFEEYAGSTLNAQEVQSYAYVDQDWKSIDDTRDYLNWAYEGPAGTTVYGYRGDTTAESGANGGVFGQRMVEIAMSIHGANTRTTLDAAIHAYQVTGQRIHWTAGNGYYGNDNGTINSFDKMLLGSIRAPNGVQTRTELDVVAAEKAARGMGWTNRLPSSYVFAAGQCFNYGTNLTAMLRAIGIPSRTQYTQNGAGWPNSFHVWAEALLDRPAIHPRQDGWWKSTWYKFDANRQYNTTGTSQIAHIEGNIAPLAIDGFGDYLLNEYKKCNGLSYRGGWEKNGFQCGNNGSGTHAAVILKPNATQSTSAFSHNVSSSSSPWALQDLFTTYSGASSPSSLSYIFTAKYGYALNDSQAGRDGGRGFIDDGTNENDLPALVPGIAQPTVVAGFGFSMYRVPVKGRSNITIRMLQGADKARVLATYDRLIYSTGKRYELNFDAQSNADGVLSIDGSGKQQVYLWVENKFSHATPGVGQETTWVTLLDDSGTSTNTPPSASFTATSSNLTASFTDTSTDSDGSIASRTWDFGDGIQSTQANPSHTYAAAGTYAVTLTVVDDKGASSSTTRQVTVSNAANAAPVASFTASTSNLTASFTDTSTDSDGSIASRSWDFGDGSTSTVANPSHTFAAAGTYSVRLTVTDDKGATNTATRSITVTAAPDGVQTYANETDVAIPDNTTVSSRIPVSDRTGNAPRDAKVNVNIVHPNRGQLTISLVAPDGSVYTLKQSDLFDNTANVNATYTVNLSSETLNGTWRLRVNDFGIGVSTGTLDRWSVTF
jgi:PKD repeat protein